MLAHLRRSLVNAGLISLLALAGCSPTDSIVEIRELHEAGRYQASLEPLRELLEEEPGNPELHFLYGSALRRTGEPGLAIWSLEMASQSPDLALAANLELAGAALGNQSFPIAIEATTRILEVEPDHVAALSMRGAAYLGDRTEPEAALADFDRLLELDPDDFNARLQRALALLLLKRVDEAQEAIAQLSVDREGEPVAQDTAASICIAGAVFAAERGENEEARTRIEACLEDFPAQWPVISEAIAFFDARSQPSRSEEILRAALIERPDAARYRTALSDRLLARGEEAEAETLLREGTELESVSAASHSWAALATLHLSRSNYEAAADAYEKALAFDPEPSQDSLLDFADLLALAGRHDRALEVAQDFEQPIFRDLINARVLLARDQPRAALERLDNALRLWPNNAAARYHAARASERIGNFDRAIEEYRQAIRAGATHTDTPMRLARLLEADRSPMAALIAVGHRLGSHPNDAEAILLALRVSEEMNDRAKVRRYLSMCQARPGLWPRALAISAEAVAKRQDAGAAVEALLGDRRLDLEDPINAPLLRVLIDLMDTAGRREEAASLVSAAIESHPNSARLQAIRGLLLERQGAAESEIRAAYQRALALDAGEPDAVTALARLESRSGNIDVALSVCDAAIESQPLKRDSGPTRDCALLLEESGRHGQAEPLLEELLIEFPYDAAAARALARIRTARGADPERTRELEQRAIRFGDAAQAAKSTSAAESNQRDLASPSA